METWTSFEVKLGSSLLISVMQWKCNTLLRDETGQQLLKYCFSAVNDKTDKLLSEHVKIRITAEFG